MVLENQKRNKILWLFFEYPNRNFTIRDISKKTKIPASSVQRYITELKGRNLISGGNKLVIDNYSRFLKCFFMIDKMYKVGLTDYLIKELEPSVIILFGSIRKGEYDTNSDIDLFIESTKKKKLNLLYFQKKINHNIQLFIETDIQNLQPNLFNNIINGVKLYGYIKVI